MFETAMTFLFIIAQSIRVVVPVLLVVFIVYRVSKKCVPPPSKQEFTTAILPWILATLFLWKVDKIPQHLSILMSLFGIAVPVLLVLFFCYRILMSHMPLFSKQEIVVCLPWILVTVLLWNAEKLSPYEYEISPNVKIVDVIVLMSMQTLYAFAVSIPLFLLTKTQTGLLYRLFFAIYLGAGAGATSFESGLHLCNSGVPSYQAGLTAILVLGVCISSRNMIIAVISILPLLITGHLSCQTYADLVHHAGVAGRLDQAFSWSPLPENLQIQDRVRALNMTLIEIGQNDSTVYEAGWLHRQQFIRKNAERFDSELQSGFPFGKVDQPVHSYWHSSFTGLYHRDWQDSRLWYSGGRLSDQAAPLVLKTYFMLPVDDEEFPAEYQKEREKMAVLRSEIFESKISARRGEAMRRRPGDTAP